MKSAIAVLSPHCLRNDGGVITTQGFGPECSCLLGKFADMCESVLHMTD